jgi:ATP-binding cassette, subfamily B, bacterial
VSRGNQQHEMNSEDNRDSKQAAARSPRDTEVTQPRAAEERRTDPDTVSFTKLLALTRPALSLVWRSSRSETIRMATLQTLSGLALPAQILAGKWALESVLKVSRQGAGMDAAIPPVAVALTAMVAARVIVVAASDTRRLLPELVGQTAQAMLAEKAASLDLASLENPSFHDRFLRAQREAMFRPVNMVGDLTHVISSGVALIGLLALVMSIQPILVFVVAAAFLPLWSSSVGHGRAFYSYYVRNTTTQRLTAYLQSILTRSETAKEVRAFHLAPYLLKRQRALFDERFDELRQLSRTRLRRDLMASLVTQIPL